MRAFGGPREDSTFRDLCSFTVRTHGQRLDHPGVAVTETPGVHATARTSVCGKTKKQIHNKHKLKSTTISFNSSPFKLKLKTNTQLSLIINKSRLTSNAILHNNLQEAGQLLSPLYPTNIQVFFSENTSDVTVGRWSFTELHTASVRVAIAPEGLFNFHSLGN